MTGSGGAYVGPDRRQAFSRTVHQPSRRLLVTISVVVLVYGVLVPTGVALAVGTGHAVAAANITIVVCAILFAQAGLLFFLRWRLTGDSRMCFLGVACSAYGFLVAPLAEGLGLLAATANEHASAQPLAQSLVGLVAAVFAARTAFAPPVNSGLRPVRTIGAALVGLVLLCGIAFAADSLLPHGRHHALTVVTTSVAGAAWLVSGALVALRGRHGRFPLSALLSGPLLVMGLSSIAWVVSEYVAVPFSLDAAALAMVAALLLAGGAAYALLATLSDQGTSALRLRSMLKSLERYRALEEERTHDARSALLAVQTAITALTRYRERLDEQSRTNLELAVDSELDRLVDLMGTHEQANEDGDTQRFDVSEPVTTVVRAAAAFGVHAELDVPSEGCRALGHRDDLARVIETLLDNARRYAPDTPIRVRVRQQGAVVTVCVADGGPGIPPEERDLVFSRGVRGSTSVGKPGSGLGLFAARRLMEDQGGSLVYRPNRPSGARFIAMLPAAPAAPVASVPAAVVRSGPDAVRRGTGGLGAVWVARTAVPSAHESPTADGVHDERD